MRSYSISGFGGSYEWGCQCMLKRGLEWLQTHPQFDFASAYKQYANVTSVCMAENGTAKELDKYMMDDPLLHDFGVTGAMHHAVVNHLAYIHKNGLEKWHTEMTAARPEPGGIYEDYDVEALRPGKEKVQ